MFRFIPTHIHGYLDYLMGILLIAAPWIFGFADTGAAAWVPILVGIAVIVYSLITAYEVSIANILSMSTHLWLDGLGGLFLTVSPWLLGFADVIWWPHVLFGLLEVAAAMFTKTNAVPNPAPEAPVKERQPNRSSSAATTSSTNNRNRRDNSITR